MLIEGSPPGEMDDTIIGLVNSQTGCPLDVASHTRVADAGLPCLERADDAADHESAAGLTHFISEKAQVGNGHGSTRVGGLRMQCNHMPTPSRFLT
jgi:hypothetical protein